jgi:hypothetical protein
VGADLIRTALDLEPAEGTVVADSLGETACIFLIVRQHPWVEPERVIA